MASSLIRVRRGPAKVEYIKHSRCSIDEYASLSLRLVVVGIFYVCFVDMTGECLECMCFVCSVFVYLVDAFRCIFLVEVSRWFMASTCLLAVY